MSDVHQGGCLCGAVRYQVIGQPVAAYVCYCDYCKRASGTGFQIPVFFKAKQVTFEGQALASYDYVSPVHGRTIQTQFCPSCGTRVASKISRVPSVTLISGGTFDQPDWYPITCHLFAQHALSWLQMPRDVPCYQQHFISESGEPQQAMDIK